MARVFGAKAFRVVIAATGVPQALLSTTQFTDAFRVAAKSTNAGSFVIGDSTVTNGAAAATDGEPIAAGEGMDFDISVRNASITTEFDLNVVYVVGTINDVLYVTYIKKAD